MGILNGIKVLDFTHFIAGPHCTQILADHGADVIKIEPINGEPSRKANPMYEDSSIYFAAMNRNKRAISLDMKAESSKAIIHRLVESADIVVTNYSVGVPERLGIDYEKISKINPRIIMVHITGFGLTGPMKNDGAFDGIIQAMSGISHLTGEADGAPLKTGIFSADHIAAFQGAIGALLAIVSRDRTGKGQLVDVSMLDSMVSMLAYNLSLVSVFGKKPHRAGNRSTNVFATTFKTADGYIYIAALTKQMWIDFCDVIGRPEFKEKYESPNDRLKDYDYLEEEITKWTSSRTTEDVVSLLLEKRIACGKVNSVEELLNHKQLQNREMLLELELDNQEIIVPGIVIKMSEDKGTRKNNVPSIGENTKEILTEIGFTEQDLKRFSDALSY